MLVISPVSPRTPELLDTAGVFWMEESKDMQLDWSSGSSGKRVVVLEGVRESSGALLSPLKDEFNMECGIPVVADSLPTGASGGEEVLGAKRVLRRTRSFYRRADLVGEDDEDAHGGDIASSLFDAIVEDVPLSLNEIRSLDLPFQSFVGRTTMQRSSSISEGVGCALERKLVAPRMSARSLSLVNNLELWMVDKVYSLSCQKLSRGKQALQQEVIMNNLVKRLTQKFPALLLRAV
ncbi:hypothetical protein HDU98_011487 [Podochytrium sp. JEL0797]|nr:hypothetical protein HDU98_011487 [Podochytrium sp. JEL0797]